MPSYYNSQLVICKTFTFTNFSATANRRFCESTFVCINVFWLYVALMSNLRHTYVAFCRVFWLYVELTSHLRRVFSFTSHLFKVTLVLRRNFAVTYKVIMCIRSSITIFSTLFVPNKPQKVQFGVRSQLFKS
jgi:hypothetical protein